MKKILVFLFILIVTGITIFQYRENFLLRSQPPSTQWAKEVKIDSGNITDDPQLIKYKENYIIAHNDNGNVKVIEVDALGRKVREKAYPGNGTNVRSVHIVTDGEDLFLSWLYNDKDIKNIHTLRLGNQLDIKEKSELINVEDIKQAGNSLLITAFKDKIVVKDYISGKSSEINAPKNSLLAGSRGNGKSIISFMNNMGDFNYFLVQDGVASEVKPAGVMKETNRLIYYNAAVAMEGDKGYILGEYKDRSQFGGSKIMEFALDGSKYNYRETADNQKVIQLFNIASYTYSDSLRFIAGGDRPYGKKATYSDILDFGIKDLKATERIPVSRTRELSLYPSGYGDTVIYCDVTGIDKTTLYMTSTREDFKAVNNNSRLSEYLLALIDTFQSFLFTFVFIFVYGMLWIIPSICVTSIVSLFEYRVRDNIRKVVFLASYFISYLFKAFAIYYISYKKFKMFLPVYLTPAIGLTAAFIISTVSCVYAYRRFTSDMEKNTISSNFSSAFMLDSWLTLFIFVPFIR